MSSYSSVYQQFEHTLAWHCAPSLTGIKPADLICWEPPHTGAGELLGHYTKLLAGCGVQLHILRSCGSRLLILVFRPAQLEQCLSQQDVRGTLAREGYPVETPLDVGALLTHLCCRLEQKEFPHEIGLFLGYPVADVEGFRMHGGRNCKLSGCWKVYGDADYARHMFKQFLRCRQTLTRRLEGGLRLDQILTPIQAYNERI